MYKFVSNVRQAWRGVTGGRANVGCARTGRGQRDDIGRTVRAAALAHVIGLRPEKDGIDLDAIGSEEPDYFAALAQLEINVQVGLIGRVLPRLAVRPDQEIPFWRDTVAG